jgi:predicted GIY-YIG superfamily endonuclease
MHKKGLGGRYTRMHEPEELVYTEEFENRFDAMRRERKIKTFSHNKKQQLINYQNSSVQLPNQQKGDEHQQFLFSASLV